MSAQRELLRAAGWQRVARLQRRLSSAGKAGIDAVLAVLGIDGRFNRGSQQLVNHLVFGLSGPDLDSTALGCGADDSLDDIVLLITATAVHVICDEGGHAVLLPIVAGWRGLVIHCLAGKAADQEAVDDFKLHSFVSATRGLASIGVPLHGAAPFDVIETWPLIQAFAHEESGGGGFFSLVCTAVDATPVIDPLYAEFDVMAIRHVLHSQLPRFSKQWDGFIGAVVDSRGTVPTAAAEGEVEGPAEPPAELTPQMVGTAFATYWDHGKALSTRPVDGTLAPTLAVSGGDGPAARAMRCELADPCGPVRCARTALGMGDWIQLAVYNLLIELAHEGIARFADRSGPEYRNPTAVAKVLVDGFAERAASRVPLDTGFSWWSYDQFSCQFSQRDFLGGSVGSNVAGRPLAGLMAITLRATGLPTQAERGGSDLVYAECFTSGTMVCTVSEDIRGTHSIDIDQAYVVTAGIAKHISMQPNITVPTDAADPLFAGLGEPLIPAAMDVSVMHYGQRFGSAVFFFRHGIALCHPAFGVLTLAAEVGDADDQAAVPGRRHRLLDVVHVPAGSACALLIEAEPEIEGDSGRFWGPVPVGTIVLQMPASVQGTFLRDVWPSWSDAEDALLVEMPIRSEAELPRAVLKHLDPEQAFFAGANPGIPRPQTSLSASHVLDYCLREGRVAAGMPSLQAATAPASAAQPRVPLSILTGIPGSGKARVSASIVALTKESTRWIVLRPEMEWGIVFVASRLHEQLMAPAVLAAVAARPSGPEAAGPRTRILVITAGFGDIAEVVRAIKTHPNVAVRAGVQIASASCCVDPGNCFWEESMTFPNLLEQCAEGWCSTVMLTGESGSLKQLKTAEALVRAANPSAAVIRCEDGRIVDAAGFEATLAVDTFESRALQGVRFASFGCADEAIPAGPGSGDFGSETVAFAPPLQHGLLVEQLNKLQADRGTNLYRIKARVLLLDDTRPGGRPEWHKVHFVKRSGHMSITPMKLQGVGLKCTFLFVGTGLCADMLKDWLRGCAVAQLETRSLRTKYDLSAKERASLAATARASPLPAGYFHNGRQYVCMDGTKSVDHPLLEDSVAEYLAAANVAVEAHNRQADAPPGRDLFAAPKASPIRPSAPPTAPPSGRPEPRRSAPSTPQKDGDPAAAAAAAAASPARPTPPRRPAAPRSGGPRPGRSSRRLSKEAKDN